jgi:hypothetical protein
MNPSRTITNLSFAAGSRARRVYSVSGYWCKWFCSEVSTRVVVLIGKSHAPRT